MYKYGCVMMVCIILGVAAIQGEGEGGEGVVSFKKSIWIKRNHNSK